MGLGNRHAVLHQTVGAQKHATDTSVFQVFKVGQHVLTCDGIPGSVTAVWDGPAPGYEQYDVQLQNGLGGGQYTASQLSAIGPAVASEYHTADRDYPELGSILYDRPPIEHVPRVAATDEPMDPTSLTDPFEWSGDDSRLQSPDLSRMLPGTAAEGAPVDMPAYVDPEWKNHGRSF